MGNNWSMEADRSAADLPDDNDPVDRNRWVEFPRPPRTKPRHGGSILMAAMLGLADALGFDRDERDPTEMVQPAQPRDRPDLDLDFGDLAPLDDSDDHRSLN